MSYSSSLRGCADASKLDRAMLDISPDDAVDLNNKKRILRWDAKKRKFVKVSVSTYCAHFDYRLYRNVCRVCTHLVQLCAPPIGSYPRHYLLFSNALSS